MLRQYVLSALAVGALWMPSANACGDYGCLTELNLTHAIYDGCNDVPFLSPANDTRTTLQLLFSDGTDRTLMPARRLTPGEPVVPFNTRDWVIWPTDRRPPLESKEDEAEPAGYALGEGHRCQSDPEGLRQFSAAIGNAKALPKTERDLLDAARRKLQMSCKPLDAEPWAPPANIHSPMGRQFSRYMDGAYAFYSGSFSDALGVFSALSNSDDPWLKETALYMQARVQINRAMEAARGMYEILKVLSPAEKAMAREAGGAFKRYLTAYPDGRYAKSARGLLRRAYWLSGDHAELEEAFHAALTYPQQVNVSLRDLVDEVDIKFLSEQEGKDPRTPRMLAVQDLKRMRHVEDSDHANRTITLKELQAQRAQFQQGPHPLPALHDYLVGAFHFYVARRPEETLKVLAKDSLGVANDYVTFSYLSLRGFALEATGKGADARSLWLRMLQVAKHPLQRAHLELALAINYEQAGMIEAVFAADSPIKDPAIRAQLLSFVAGPDLLRRQALSAATPPWERELASYVLLRKELGRGRYAEFLADLRRLPIESGERLEPIRWAGGTTDSGYVCPSLARIAEALSKDPEDGHASNCLGEWARARGIDYEEQSVPMHGTVQRDAPRSGRTLGSGPSQFPGKPYSRLDGYMKVIANPRVDADARAYALFRAVRCYEPSGANSCGFQDVPISTRKRWFHTLKTSYGKSRWAKSLRYYW